MDALTSVEARLVDIVRSHPAGVWSHQLGNNRITYQHARSAEAKGWITVHLYGDHWFACV